MSISYCPGCYTDDLLEEYPFLNDVEIYTVDWYDLPPDVLAATDCEKRIYVRRDLPWLLFNHSLYHEAEHILKKRQNIDASEFEVEMDARKKSGLNLDYIV